jgi:hypothetical protein
MRKKEPASTKSSRGVAHEANRVPSYHQIFNLVVVADGQEFVEVLMEHRVSVPLPDTAQAKAQRRSTVHSQGVLAIPDIRRASFHRSSRTCGWSCPLAELWPLPDYIKRSITARNYNTILILGSQDQMRPQALKLLRQALGNADAEFRDGQFEAIVALVQRHARLLVVQRTGWARVLSTF